jgi:hypothetical protein
MMTKEKEETSIDIFMGRRLGNAFSMFEWVGPLLGYSSMS